MSPEDTLERKGLKYAQKPGEVDGPLAALNLVGRYRDEIRDRPWFEAIFILAAAVLPVVWLVGRVAYGWPVWYLPAAFLAGAAVGAAVYVTAMVAWKVAVQSNPDLVAPDTYVIAQHRTGSARHWATAHITRQWGDICRAPALQGVGAVIPTAPQVTVGPRTPSDRKVGGFFEHHRGDIAEWINLIVPAVAGWDPEKFARGLKDRFDFHLCDWHLADEGAALHVELWRGDVFPLEADSPETYAELITRRWPYIVKRVDPKDHPSTRPTLVSVTCGALEPEKPGSENAVSIVARDRPVTISLEIRFDPTRTAVSAAYEFLDRVRRLLGYALSEIEHGDNDIIRGSYRRDAMRPVYEIGTPGQVAANHAHAVALAEQLGRRTPPLPEAVPIDVIGSHGPGRMVWLLDPSGDFTGPDLTFNPHAIGTGATGTGKSSFVTTSIAHGLSHNLPMLILDGKEDGEFDPYAADIPVVGFSRPQAALNALRWAMKDVGDHNSELKQRHRVAHLHELPADVQRLEARRCLILVDEVNAWFTEANRRGCNRAYVEVAAALYEISQRGRSKGLHLTMTAQAGNPDAIFEGYGTKMVKNVATRGTLGEIDAMTGKWLYDGNLTPPLLTELKKNVRGRGGFIGLDEENQQTAKVGQMLLIPWSAFEQLLDDYDYEYPEKMAALLVAGRLVDPAEDRAPIRAVPPMPPEPSATPTEPPATPTVEADATTADPPWVTAAEQLADDDDDAA